MCAHSPYSPPPSWGRDREGGIAERLPSGIPPPLTLSPRGERGSDAAPTWPHHSAASFARRAAIACGLERWLAWQMAMASASASSALSNFAFGSRKPIMAWICFFSAWPAPTTVFLMTLGAYSAIAQAPLGRGQQRHAARLAQLQRRARILVDEGLLDRRLLRLEAGDHPAEALVELAQAVGQFAVAVRGDQAAGHIGRAARRRTRRYPSPCGAGRDRCR